MIFFPLPVDKPFQDSQKLDCTKNALIGVQAPPHFFFKKVVFFVVVAFFSFFFSFFKKLCAKNIGLLRFSSCVSQESHRTKSPVLDVRTSGQGKSVLGICYLKEFFSLCRMAHLCNLSTWEAEAGEHQGWRASLGYIYCEIVSKRQKYDLNETSSIFYSEYALLNV